MDTKNKLNHTFKNKNIKRTLMYFPERDTIKDSKDLKNKWDFVTISAHGSLLPDKFIKIPKDTYVIFNSGSGTKSISKCGITYSNLLINYSVDEFYKKMLEEIKNPKSLLKTFESTTNKSYYANNYEQKERTLAQHIENFSLTDEQKSRAIYPPNSESFDMILNFKNQYKKQYRGFILGVHKLPIHPNIYEKYTSYNTLKYEEDSIHRYNKNISKLDEFTKSSIVSEALFKTMRLSELFTLLPPIPSGKKRFIFITACRGINTNIKNNDEQKLLKRLTRKYSIGLRENVKPNSNFNIIGKKAKEDLQLYSYWKRLGILDINKHNITIDISKLPIYIEPLDEFKYLFL